MDLGTIIDAAVARDPSALAFVDGDIRKSFAGWQDDISRVAGGLQKKGLARGDHLVAIMANRYEMATLYWACQRLAAIFTPFNWRATADDIAFVLEDAEAVLVVFDDGAAPAVKEAAAKSGLQNDALIAVSGGGAGISFDDLLRADPILSPAGAADHETCLMLYTSGTTGRPKGVPRSHRAERTAAASCIAHLRYEFGESQLGVMPLFHTMGIRILLASAMLNGAFINMRGFDAGG
ncbi:MAG: AMP-binding protein, partial [Rhodospirillaceae bacterium]|nr:AMP-binding protein [Rhodospirillaceae bacterium]